MSLIIGPLTTTFTPPAICFSDIFFDGSTTAILAGLHFADPCFPNNFYSGHRFHYYAPGICPYGYTVACIAFLIIDPATTWSQCCPSEYACEDRSFCTSTLHEDRVITAAYGGSDTKTAHSGIAVSAFPIGVLSAVTPKTITEVVIISSAAATTISLTDSTFFSASTSADEITTNIGPTTTATITTTEDLSQSAKVAIGVSISVAALLLALVGAVVWRRQRLNRGEVEPAAYESQVAEMGAAYGNQVIEMGAAYENQVVEIGRGRAQHELPAEPIKWEML